MEIWQDLEKNATQIMIFLPHYMWAENKNTLEHHWHCFCFDFSAGYQLHLNGIYFRFIFLNLKRAKMSPLVKLQIQYIHVTAEDQKFTFVDYLMLRSFFRKLFRFIRGVFWTFNDFKCYTVQPSWPLPNFDCGQYLSALNKQWTADTELSYSFSCFLYT